jgi:hypothetical protein
MHGAATQVSTESRPRNILAWTQVLLFIAATTVTGGCTTSSDPHEVENNTFLSVDDARFLEGLTVAVLNAARVPAGATVADQPPNATGFTLIRPSATNTHPAFWIRDFAMSLDSGLITLDEQRHALLQAAFHQQDGELLLPTTGARVPQGAIPDHITFDGIPIFFPGTLNDYAGQGGGPWGAYSCFDTPFYFVHMAYFLVQSSQDFSVLQTNVRGKTILKRLQLAYGMPPHRAESGLVSCTDATRGVNFGFVDTVEQTGELLMSSLLKLRAAVQLATLMDAAGNTLAGDLYREDAAHIREAIATTFPLDTGFLRASTGRSAQPDVWGTAFAVYMRVLPPETELRACTALANAYQSGTIAWNGLIRHVPTDADFNSSTMWESAQSEKNRYQNGAYWATPTGWVVDAIASVDRNLAQQLAGEYIATLREGDFRKGKQNGEPWQCAHPTGDYHLNSAYLTSVSAPFAAFRRMAAGR